MDKKNFLQEFKTTLIKENYNLDEDEETIDTNETPDITSTEIIPDESEAALQDLKSIKYLDSKTESIERLINAYETKKNAGDEVGANRIAAALAQIFNISHKYIIAIIKRFGFIPGKGMVAGRYLIDPDGDSVLYDLASDYLDAQIFSGTSVKGRSKGKNRWLKTLDDYLENRIKTGKDCCFVAYFKAIMNRKILQFKQKYFNEYRKRSLDTPMGKEGNFTLGDTMGTSDLSYDDKKKEEKRLRLEQALNNAIDQFGEILKSKNAEYSALWNFKVIKKLKADAVVNEIVDKGADYGEINKVLAPILELGGDKPLSGKVGTTMGSLYNKLKEKGVGDNQIKKTLCKQYLNEINKGLKRTLKSEGSTLRGTLKALFISNGVVVQGNKKAEDQERELDNIIFNFVDEALGKKDGALGEKAEKEKALQQLKQGLKDKPSFENEPPPPQKNMEPEEIEDWLKSQGLEEPGKVKDGVPEEELYEGTASGNDVVFVYHQFNPSKFIDSMMQIEQGEEKSLRTEIRKILLKKYNLL